MEKSEAFLSTPIAILLGSFVIAVSILVSGGIIQIGKPTSAVPAPTAQQAGNPQQAKTEADIVTKLKEYAAKLSLDKGKFDSCLDSGSKAVLVKADQDAGTKVGVNGTPAFFINGYGINGAQPYSVFKDTFDFILSGGDFNNPSEKVKYLVDGNPNNGEIDKVKQQVEAGDLPVLGNQSATLTVVEFSDYECPFCSRHFTQTEGSIKKDYIDTGKVKMYYRDFPLSQIHPGAQKAAEAARCAGDQNKYWQYHDLIFQDQAQIF